MSELVLLIDERYAGQADPLKDAISKMFGASLRVVLVANESWEEDLKALRAGGATMAFVVSFLGPMLLSRLKKACNLVALDDLLLHIAGAHTNERIAVLTSSPLQERVLVENKGVYEVTPKQLEVVKVDAGDLKAMGEGLKRLITLGYMKAFLGSPDLILSSEDTWEILLEEVGVRKGFEFINPLDVLEEFLPYLAKEPAKPTAFELSRILPCVADSAKIRVIAQFNSPIGHVLPYLYLHFKNSKYLEPLGTLTFLTEQEEMVTLFSSGRACVVKVKDEERARNILEELLNLMAKAHELWTKRGSPSSELLEARRRLNVMSIYGLLPKTNCRACGEETCMAFSVKLMSGAAKVEHCRPLSSDERFKASYRRLKEITASPLV
ncbi:MAG: (Fe-S)-binding protein [Candidatus Nezhaarchaeota archaeon]|nr:(Fe-S)-binding protein [Candidatus Nezhaarchaeota archaeon]